MRRRIPSWNRTEEIQNSTPEASVFVTEQRVSREKQGFRDTELGCTVTEQIVFATKQCWFMKKQRRFAVKPHCFSKNQYGFAPM